MKTLEMNCPFCGGDHKPSEPHVIDAFTGVRQYFARRRRTPAYPCDDCGIRRVLQTATLEPGMEADLCRQCLVNYPEAVI